MLDNMRQNVLFSHDCQKSYFLFLVLYTLSMSSFFAENQSPVKMLPTVVMLVECFGLFVQKSSVSFCLVCCSFLNSF